MKAPGIGRVADLTKARQRFVEMEDELWQEHWPRPPEALDLTSFAGTTRVYRWPGDGEPVVFLHGMGATGPLLVAATSSAFAGRDVYAIDTIGDVGRSEQREVIADAAGLATWLDETLAGAGLDRAHLAGTSYGGFLALNLASALAETGRIADPDRQRRARSLPLGPVHAVGDADAARRRWRHDGCGSGSHEPVRCSRTRA